jgi:hypothetical protein
MPKVTYLTGNCTVSEDFIQLLFKRDSDVLKDITDRKELKQISDIIESVLKSAKKKVQLQIQGEPSAQILDQLNLIRRDRLPSESTTTSSTHTSPLHFHGKQLNKAPSPGPDSSLMQEFNKIFSVRMQRLCAMIKTNVLGLHPVDGYINKFYIYRWDLLIEAFESDMIYVWQVKVSAENEFIMTITDTKQKPVIENAKSIVNIKSLSLTTDPMTELARLILLRVENVKTRNMTLLLFGCKGYFRVCGFLNSKENFVDGFVAKPTRVTHPRLTAKIQKIYNVWYGIKKSKEKALKEMEETKVEEEKAQESIDMDIEETAPEVVNEEVVEEIVEEPEEPVFTTPKVIPVKKIVLDKNVRKLTPELIKKVIVPSVSVPEPAKTQEISDDDDDDDLMLTDDDVVEKVEPARISSMPKGCEKVNHFKIKFSKIIKISC